MTPPRRLAAAAFALVAAVSLTACEGDAPEGDASPAPTVDQSQDSRSTPTPAAATATPTPAPAAAPPGADEACELVVTAIEYDLSLYEDYVGVQMWLAEAEAAAPDELKTGIQATGEALRAAETSGSRKLGEERPPLSGFVDDAQRAAMLALIDQCEAAGVDIVNVEPPEATPAQICYLLQGTADLNAVFDRRELLDEIDRAISVAPQDMQLGLELLRQFAQARGDARFDMPEDTAENEAAFNGLFETCAAEGAPLPG